MKELVLAILFFFCVNICFSHEIFHVKGEYTFIAPETMTIQQAKEIALQRAKIQAIADEFGTVVSQTNYTNIKNSKSHSSINFQAIGLSELRGEWIETTKEPRYEISYSEGMQIVSVVVEGSIRKLNNAYAKINVKTLRNKPDARFESTEFHNNDDLFISFQSPLDGYLAIYLLDGNDNAYCLLPYARQSNGVYSVIANKEYFFFSKTDCIISEKQFVDEYTLNCGSEVEYNKIVVIFSDNYFIKSVDLDISMQLPRQLSTKDFNIWVAKSRTSDTHMQVKEIPIKIIP